MRQNAEQTAEVQMEADVREKCAAEGGNGCVIALLVYRIR